MSYSVIVQTGAMMKGVAKLLEPDDIGVPTFELVEGSPLADRFRSGSVLRFDPSDKEGRKLVDLQRNTWGAFPVSARLRAVLESEPEIEFLPIRIADHRGKIVSTDYSLANFLSPIDCVDMGQSTCRVDAMDRARVDRIEKLAIDPKRVPRKRRAFRLSIRPRTVVVDEEIAEEIRAQKLTGIECIAEEEYKSIGKLGV